MLKHIVAAGESFDSLALTYYGDENLASKIIQANPDYCDTLIFEAGIVLNIPDMTEVKPLETLPPWRRGE
jgi:phage tail protein X